jgi:lipopolysaccharide export system protein LptA
MKRIQVSIIFLLVSVFPLTGFSLESDKKLPMVIKANSAEMNNSNHKGKFSGNVELDQGTTHLRANKAITHGTIQNKLKLAIAKGSKNKQAHYWSTTDPKKPLLHAYADIIEYYPLENKILLIGNALVKQGKDTYTAPKIEYNTKTQHVLSASHNKGRTTIIINPKRAKA